MWYYAVCTLKHLHDEHRAPMENTILNIFKSFETVIIIKEFGKNGDNPHLNIVTEMLESTFKTTRQTIKRRYEEIGKQFYTKYTVDAKKCNNKIQAANVIAGYLHKEVEKEVLLNNNIDISEMESLREDKKFDINSHTPIVLKTQFLDLLLNLYENNYKEQPFDKRLYCDMIIDIRHNRDITTSRCDIREMYFQLDCMLNQGNQCRAHIMWMLENYQ